MCLSHLYEILMAAIACPSVRQVSFDYLNRKYTTENLGDNNKISFFGLKIGR